MPKILVVEDNKLLQDIMLRQLTMHEYAVILAHNGVDAVSQSKSERPDLIIMDLRLPRLSGGDAIDQIRADPLTSEIPILVMNAQPQHVVNSVAPEDYLVKPFGFDELLQRIHVHLGTS